MSLSMWVSATTQLAFVSVHATGTGDVVPVNLTLWGNGNTVGVPVTPYCNGCSSTATAGMKVRGERKP